MFIGTALRINREGSFRSETFLNRRHVSPPKGLAKLYDARCYKHLAPTGPSLPTVPRLLSAESSATLLFRP
jgi:hypothetical protein